MFARFLLVLVLTIGLWALFVRDTGASGLEQRYHVRAGDTLWSIAVAHFAGDPREGVWELQHRNRLTTATIRPGQVLVLPA
jgi:LysM repeat protein